MSRCALFAALPATCPNNDTRVFFGLDGEDEVDVLEVVWLGGREVQRFVDVEADQLIVIKQGQAAVETRSLW